MWNDSMFSIKKTITADTVGVVFFFSWIARFIYQIYSENECTNGTRRIDRSEEQKQTSVEREELYHKEQYKRARSCSSQYEGGGGGGGALGSGGTNPLLLFW